MGRVLSGAFLAAAAVALLASSGLARAQNLRDAPRITQQEFKRLIAARAVIIVDTRNADSYAEGHIPGAILLPLEGLRSFPPEYDATVAKLKSAAKPVVTYCA